MQFQNSYFSPFATIVLMKALEHCIYCSQPLYRLNDGMVKCSSCKKKYSPKKYLNDLQIIHAFCDDLSALRVSRMFHINYLTVKKRFDRFRWLIAAYQEECYLSRDCEVSEYEEYFYLEASKRHDPKSIFDAHNFLTFDYGGLIYTLLMPSLQRHKEQFLADGLEENYYKEFNKYLRINRISKLQRRENRITRFWDFFEHFILRYKGVSDEYFPYYLKEAEFKFNHPPQRQREILEKLWLGSKS